MHSDAKFLANYAYINLNDPIARLTVVRSNAGFRRREICHAARVKPDQLAKLGITVTERSDAIQARTR